MMERSNYLGSAFVLWISIVSLNATLAHAQDLGVDHKMVGHQATVAQQHAQDVAQALYHYSQSHNPIPKPEAQQLVDDIQRDLKAIDAALEKLEADFSKNKQAVSLIESLKVHYAKAQEEHDRAADACAKEPSRKALLGDCCSKLWYEIEGAKTDLQQLLKLLKIEKLEPPHKAAPKRGGSRSLSGKGRKLIAVARSATTATCA